MQHKLKILQEYFEAVTEPNPMKRKTVEIRKDDRGYRVGDTLLLQEIDHIQRYTGREAEVLVTHITKGQPWLPEGYVALSILIDESKQKQPRHLPLTKRQRQIYEFIKAEIAAKGYPPTVREINAAIGLNSVSTVHAHLEALEKKGLIKRDPDKPRAIQIV